jgi:DNA polymerase V
MKNRSYIAIDLKSFYASVECNERGLDPLTTNLVVADASRTEKTICLRSPSLKHMAFPAGQGCLRLLRRSGKSMRHGWAARPGVRFPVLPSMMWN